MTGKFNCKGSQNCNFSKKYMATTLEREADSQNKKDSTFIYEKMSVSSRNSQD